MEGAAFGADDEMVAIAVVAVIGGAIFFEGVVG